MNIKKIALSTIFSATILTTRLLAQNESGLQNDDSVTPSTPTEWTKRPYVNNEDETKQLCVPGASALKVSVSGETEENFDFLTIKDNNTVDKPLKLSGKLNNKFVVHGDCIETTFTSDDTVTKEGFTITVEEASSIPTKWTKRPYENNEDKTKELCVDGAGSIVVTITGEIESAYDFLNISDTSGNKLLPQLSGVLNEKLLVEGNCTSAHFTSDYSVTKEGFTITVVDANDTTAP